MHSGRFMIKTLSLVLASSIIFGLSACTQNKAPLAPQEIISQKTVGANKTPITVLVKYAFSINSFEEAVEKKFPDIDIVQVGNYTRDMGIAEYESRIEHDDLTDIVMTWPLDVGEQYWDDRLLDLSSMNFTSKYSISMLDNISRDGKLYYLPGPSQIRGILYNKTLFEENGWEIPSDFEGFIDLCKTIEASGIRSLQLGFQNAEVLDTAFIGYNYADFYSSPPDTLEMEKFDSGKTSFASHYAPALDTFQRMIDEGIFKASDLDVSYSVREKMLFTRQCAMVEDSVLMANMGYAMTGTSDTFALMPFFNATDSSDVDWARLYMVCYIGLNKKLALPENKDKYDIVMRLMEYISTPEGQNALAADTGAMFSSLVGIAPPDVPEVEPLVPALSRGRYAIFPTFKNAQGALREGLAGMIRGDLTKADVIKMVDAQNAFPPIVTPPKKLGTATADFGMIETGNFVTDAMREYSGCEIALFMDNGKDGRYNGKGISASLYNGDVTNIDLLRILPDLKYDEKGVLCKVSMTGQNLIQTLEYAIPVDNNKTGWFYYFSGLKMEYNPLAPMGSRIQKITTSDNKEIDPNKLYTIAAMDKTLPENLMESYEETDITILNLLTEAVQKQGTIKPSGDNRFIVPK